MLKKLIVTMALVGVTAASYGQGQVNFDTKSIGTAARILKPDGSVPTVGNLYFVQLYAAAGTGAARSALAPVGSPVNLRNGDASGGYSQIDGSTTSKGVAVNQTVNVTTVNGGPATLQMRAWSSTFDTYDDAVGKGQYGESALLSLSSTGNPNNSPPDVAPLPAGLTGFTLTDIPEPSTVALGVLGAAALCFARRRK